MPSSQLVLGDEDRATLEYWTRCSTVPAGHRERARIVLAIADGAGTSQAARTVGVSRPTVIKWRDRFAPAGVGGAGDHPPGGGAHTTHDTPNNPGGPPPPPAAVGGHPLGPPAPRQQTRGA